MRQFSNRLAEIIESSGQNLNTISRTSGVSHTYLTKLVQGQINRPGKDKIASILFTLNFKITAINRILAQYDYMPLSQKDIPGILVNNYRRKIDGSTLPLYEKLYVRLLLSSMEAMGGTKILARSTPSVLFMPDALYHADDSYMEKNSQACNFYRDFSHTLLSERKANFRKNCREGHRFETYLCKRCLEAYFERNLDEPGETANEAKATLIVRYFANAISTICRNPDQHLTMIVERCPYFIFQIQGANSKRPKVFYLGKREHNYKRREDLLNLQGFISSGPAVVELFTRETELCRQNADQVLTARYPQNLITYFKGLFKRKGRESEFEAATEKLIQAKEPVLY